MLGDLWRIVLGSAQGSFIQVTVFVGVVLLFFGYIDYSQQGAFIRAIANAKKYQPLVGALLGIIPGCGGSILVMPLYIKGTVTFGAVVATLIATAGDSAFVTLTQAPKEFAVVTALCLVSGTVVGYIVDYYKMGDWVRKRSDLEPISNLHLGHEAAESTEAAAARIHHDRLEPHIPSGFRHIGHEEGDEIDMILHHQHPLDERKLSYKITHHCHLIFWAVIAVGFVFGVMELMQIDINGFPSLPGAGVLVGVMGTAVTLGYMFCTKKVLQAQTHEDVEHKLFSLRETLIHNAEETAFVGTWVFGAYLVYEFMVYFVGGEHVIAAALASSGLMSVLLGVLIGIIPGCGPQVIFVSLYLKGMFPFAALLANAVSQDGDALFPLIAMDKKSAFWATVVNTIAALFIGFLAYFIELRLV